jgi:hypothetical protein
METRSKKLKLSHAESNELITLDPLHKIHSDLHELVLQHFNKSDVLKASEISPEWNFAVSTSSKCMMKIPLGVDMIDSLPNQIIRTQRHFNNLDISQIVVSDSSCDSFIQRNLRFIKKFSPFLENLTIFNRSEKFSVPANLKFPRLKSIDIDSSVPIVYGNATKLKKISYSAYRCTRETVEWIQNQEKLEELKLSGMQHDFLSFNPIAPKGIKKFNLSFCTAISEADEPKLDKFMEPMSETLTELRFFRRFNAENTELIINRMPKLKTLEIFPFDLNKADLRANSSINTLITFGLTQEIYNLLLSLINLENFIIRREINFAEFEWIVRNLMQLKKLSVYTNARQQIIDLYDEMKATEENINKVIELIWH